MPACGARARPPGQVVRRARATASSPTSTAAATIVEGELALDAEGNFLAVRVRSLGDMGAYLTAFGPMMPAVNMQKNLPSLYRTPMHRDLDPLRVHQHRADRPVSRRRTAGGELLHGAADRRRGARDRARPGGAAPAEPDPRERDPLHARPPGSSTTAAISPRCSMPASTRPTGHGFAGAPARPRRRRGRLRGRGLACYLEVDRAAEPGDGRHPLRAGRPGHHRSPARSTTARATPRRSPRCWSTGSACRSS